MLKLQIVDERLKQENWRMGKATKGAGAFDVRACIDAPITLLAGEVVKVPLGFIAEVEEGHLLLLLPRSGLGSAGIVLANGTGVIDSDYRGVVQAMLLNRDIFSPFTVEPTVRIAHHGRHLKLARIRASFIVEPMMRIAQATYVAASADFEVVDTVSETERGAGGFGSTGVH